MGFGNGSKRKRWLGWIGIEIGLMINYAEVNFEYGILDETK